MTDMRDYVEMAYVSWRLSGGDGVPKDQTVAKILHEFQIYEAQMEDSIRAKVASEIRATKRAHNIGLVDRPVRPDAERTTDYANDTEWAAMVAEGSFPVQKGYVPEDGNIRQHYYELSLQQSRSESIAQGNVENFDAWLGQRDDDLIRHHGGSRGQ